MGGDMVTLSPCVWAQGNRFSYRWVTAYPCLARPALSAMHTRPLHAHPSRGDQQCENSEFVAKKRGGQRMPSVEPDVSAGWWKQLFCPGTTKTSRAQRNLASLCQSSTQYAHSGRVCLPRSPSSKLPSPAPKPRFASRGELWLRYPVLRDQ